MLGFIVVLGVVCYVLCTFAIPAVFFYSGASSSGLTGLTELQSFLWSAFIATQCPPHLAGDVESLPERHCGDSGVGVWWSDMKT